MEHKIKTRVYYMDTDSGGVVYHPNYLNFAERARCELLREVGYQVSDLEKDLGYMFVLKHADIEYLAPAFLDDELEIVTKLMYMKNSSFKTRQIVRKNNEDICVMHVTLVCVDANTIKPVRLPNILREKLKPYCEEDI